MPPEGPLFARVGQPGKTKIKQKTKNGRISKREISINIRVYIHNTFKSPYVLYQSALAGYRLYERTVFLLNLFIFSPTVSTQV